MNIERIVILALIILAAVIMEAVKASGWDYYYEPVEIYDVYPTLPGIDIRDYSRPGYRIEIDRYDNERAYPTIPGTNMRDYSQPGYRIDWR